MQKLNWEKKQWHLFYDIESENNNVMHTQQWDILILIVVKFYSVVAFLSDLLELIYNFDIAHHKYSKKLDWFFYDKKTLNISLFISNELIIPLNKQDPFKKIFNTFAKLSFRVKILLFEIFCLHCFNFVIYSIAKQKQFKQLIDD